MSKATETKLNALHGIIADTLTNALAAMSEDPSSVNASVIAQAVKFLNDNSVFAVLGTGSTNEALDKLLNAAESLPFEIADTTFNKSH